MKVSIVVFPGSNCDHDMVYTYGSVLGAQVETVWHRDRDLKDANLVVIPGGFSYGDYLRTGALAKLSPVMEEVVKFAGKGGPVLGICNGFQILCEAGLLPGALLQNIGMRFLSRFVNIKVENTDTVFTREFQAGHLLNCPIAHFDGNFFADNEMLKSIEDNGQVVFRYCDQNGKVDYESRESNPNGSLKAIAGVCNQSKNVLGMMPHPERAIEHLVGYVGGDSGKAFFQSSIL